MRLRSRRAAPTTLCRGHYDGSEVDCLHQFHHLEEVGLGILQVVHHAVLAVLAKGGLQHRHLINQRLAHLGAVVLHQFALYAQRLSLEGADFGLAVVSAIWRVALVLPNAMM